MKSITQPEITQRFFELTMANGAALTDDAAIYGVMVGAIELPAAFSGTQLTMQASLDGVTWNNVHDQFGTELVITVAPSRMGSSLPKRRSSPLPP